MTKRNFSIPVEVASAFDEMWVPYGKRGQWQVISAAITLLLSQQPEKRNEMIGTVARARTMGAVENLIAEARAASLRGGILEIRPAESSGQSQSRPSTSDTHEAPPPSPRKKPKSHA